MSDETEDVAEESVKEDSAEQFASQWEFLDRVPSQHDVEALLATVAPVWGASAVDYIDYVQALPQRKKFKKPHPTNPRVMVDEYIEAYTLYMSVAGRQRMLNDVQEALGWRVEFVPEPVTPTGVPGYLQMDDRIVYREYVKIWKGEELIGSRPGTSWAPASGGSGAAASSPYQKAETSARGRALAAWGFGVLPGSGIASLEEMEQIKENGAALSVEEKHNRPARRSHADLVTDVLTTAETLRQERGLDEDVMTGRLVSFLTQRIGLQQPLDGEGNIVWSGVKEGQLMLLLNSLKDSLAKFRDEDSAV